MYHLGANKIDLNLFLSLEILLKVRSVTKAAELSGVSQSAMSHILARLRRTFQDPLLIRTKAGLLPSVRAETISPRLGKLMDAIAAIVPNNDIRIGANRKRRQVDLNLLIALKVLLDKENVTAAAAEMGISQSAMSHTLKRIRTQFNDEILVRDSSGMHPTESALTIYRQLSWVMSEVDSILEPPEFDPASARGVLRLALTDYGAATILPLIIEDLTKEAPFLNFEIEPGHSASFERLEVGELDIAVGSFINEPAGFYRQRIFDDEMVCILRADHPAVEGGLTFKDYVEMPHGVITVAGTDVLINAAFKKQGLKRRSLLSFPHFMAAPLIVARSDLVVTLPRRMADIFTGAANLAICTPPIPLKKLTIYQLWHERSKNDPAHVWLRSFIYQRLAVMDKNE
jgi:DNA-binding transcriptional LysR family regulator